MDEPIRSGDLCEVIGGALGNSGPNIGKRVTVGQLRGDHSVHGRIWRYHGEGGRRNMAGWATRRISPKRGFASCRGRVRQRRPRAARR